MPGLRMLVIEENPMRGALCCQVTSPSSQHARPQVSGILHMHIQDRIRCGVRIPAFHRNFRDFQVLLNSMLCLRSFSKCELAILFIRLIVTIARVFGPGGARSTVASCGPKRLSFLAIYGVGRFSDFNATLVSDTGEYHERMS